MTVGCMFCGKQYHDRRTHMSTCDGRQGQIEASAPLYGRQGDIGYERRSETSEQAARSISVDTMSRMESRVLAILRTCPTTCDHVEVITGLPHQTASSTIRRLVLRGRLVDSGRRETTRSGRKATVWIAA